MKPKSTGFPNVARALAIVALCVLPLTARAQAPTPPCGFEPVPAYPEVGAEPASKFWRPAEIGAVWSPPACTGWKQPGFTTLVTTVARFRYAGDADALLRRFGAISELGGVPYWSVGAQKWQTMIVSATALAGPKDKTRRADFTPAELKGGDTLYFQQTDNRLGMAIFRMRVMEWSPSRIVVTVENVSAMRKMMMTLVGPAEMQAIYLLDRESADVWRYYSILRTGADASGLLKRNPESSINRAAAFYFHYAGIPIKLHAVSGSAGPSSPSFGHALSALPKRRLHVGTYVRF